MGKKKEAEGGRCRRHPRHRPAAGVCPFCLGERLSRLSSSSLPSVVGRGPYASGSSSSAYSSSSESSEAPSSAETASPPPCRDPRCAKLSLLRRHGRVLDEEEVEGWRKARRRSFWAKLLSGRRGVRGGKELAHSKTLTERSAPKWV